MKKIITILSMIMISYSYHAQNINFQWVNPIGSAGSDQSNSVKVDNLGNIYTIGFFTGTVDFDPGPSVVNLTSAGLDDIFITKVNASGSLVWAKSCGGLTSEDARDIDFDASGNLYITGYFMGTTDFDPGAGIFNLTSTGSTDAFILKLNSSGNFVNAIRIGGSGTDIATGIKVDNAGDVVYTGRFENTVDFDAGAGTQNLTSAGGYDIFVSKLNSSLNYVWARRMGGAGYDGAFAVVVDGAENVYTTGYFASTTDFDPGAGTVNLTASGVSDIFVSCLNASGAYSWARSFTGTGEDYGYGIAIDVMTGVYVTGQFTSTIDADPGAASFNLASNGGTDAFLIKLNLSGNFLWGKSWGGTGSDVGYAVATDGLGNIWSAGAFTSNVDFDPNAGTSFMISAGSTDAFCSKLSSSGNFLLAKRWGSTGMDLSKSIRINTLNNVYNTGVFAGTTDFDPNLGTYFLTAIGGTDAYTLKFDICTNSSSTISPVTCVSYTSPSGLYTYTTSGSYIDTIANSRGCDSIININVTILNNSTNTIAVTTCNSYTSPSNNYVWNTSGIYLDTLLNLNGCDSIITINLTINNPTNSSISANGCRSYTSPSGNYIWTNSGSYTDTVPNHFGCDSIISINLTITDIDTNITISNGVFNVAQSGATYQWFDCIAQAAIVGASSQSYIPTVNGSYGVLISYNGCVDTTSCYYIGNVNLENLNDESITIYPNPTEDIIYLNTSNLDVESIGIHDALGKLLETHSPKNSFSLSSYDSGFYYLKVTLKTGKSLVMKCIKK